MARSKLALLAASAATAVVLIAAPATAAPSSVSNSLFSRSEQLIFGGSSSSSIKESNRQPDFVEVLQNQAEAAGLDLDFGLDHTAQKANEAAFQAALKAAEETTDEKEDTEEEWGSLLPSGDLEEIEAKAEAASHAAEMYASAAASKALKTATTTMEPGSGWIWKACEPSEQADGLAIQVNSIDVTPDPPKPGQNLTVNASGIVKSTVDKGTYVDVVVKIGLIRLLSKRFDVCELAEENDAEIKCPIAPGTYNLTQVVALPREIPPAKFNVHVTGQTQEEKPLLCLDLSINFGRF